MRHPAARWLLLLLAVAVAAALGYRAVLLEQHGIDTRRGLAKGAADARALQTALADVRRALAAMAAPGQPAVSWSRQAVSAIDTTRARVASLATAPGASGLAAATEQLDRLSDVAGRLREFAVDGRALMASDVAFGEALPHIYAIDAQVTGTLTKMDASGELDLAATC
jgi:hypothetical protein